MAIRTLVLLVIAVIVIAIALSFLVYVVNFDSLFLSNDQRILAKYSTCALALCAYGYNVDGTPSPEVNSVGCLKYEGGRCILSCTQLREELSEKEVHGELRGDRRVYCGEQAKLDFEFTGISLGGTVPLTSGQMDKLATPSWLCKPWMPFGFSPDDLLGNPPGATTADFLYHFTDSCIMLAKLSEVPVTTIANLFATEEQRYAGGCFTGIVFGTQEGIEDLYTPILEYDSPEQKVHPSGIYLNRDDSFTVPLSGRGKPECQLENPRQEFAITDEDISRIAAKYEGQLFDKIILDTCESPVSPENCQTEKVPFDRLSPIEQAKTARLILKEEFEGITFIDEGEECPAGRRCQQFGTTAIPESSLGQRISKCEFLTTYRGEKIAYSVYAEDTLPTPFALFGSCKTVTLDRNLEGVEAVKTATEERETPEATITISIGKTEYEVGDTVSVEGSIEGYQRSGKRFSSDKVTVYFRNMRIPGFPAEVREDIISGKFESEYHIGNEVLRGATFQVSAEYGDVQSNTVEFVIR